MNLPELPYEAPPIRWGLIVFSLLANFALAIVITMVGQ
jgi:hypothetical protein